jgi:hypothetical protein
MMLRTAGDGLDVAGDGDGSTGLGDGTAGLGTYSHEIIAILCSMTASILFYSI